MIWLDMPESWSFPVSAGRRSPGEETPYFWDPGSIGISYWGQEYLFPEGFHVEASVCWLDDATRVALRVEGAVLVECARCLEPVSLAINENFVYFYTLRPECERGEKSECVDEEHIVILQEPADVIDVRAQVWETLLESLPARALCDEECRGICLQCGANLNKGSCQCVRDADPRFAALLPLQEKNDLEGGEH